MAAARREDVPARCADVCRQGRLPHERREGGETTSAKQGAAKETEIEATGDHGGTSKSWSLRKLRNTRRVLDNGVDVKTRPRRPRDAARAAPPSPGVALGNDGQEQAHSDPRQRRCPRPTGRRVITRSNRCGSPENANASPREMTPTVKTGSTQDRRAWPRVRGQAAPRQAAERPCTAAPQCPCGRPHWTPAVRVQTQGESRAWGSRAAGHDD